MVQVKAQLLTVGALVLIGGGVGLGLALSGSGSASKPVTVQPVSQTVITGSNSASGAVPSASAASTVSSSAAAVAAPVQKAVPVSQPNEKATESAPQPANSTYVDMHTLFPGAPVPNLAPMPVSSPVAPPSN